MIVLHHQYGQLANRLIVALHFIAFCLENKKSLKVLSLGQYYDEFDEESFGFLRSESILIKKRTWLTEKSIALGYFLSSKGVVFKVINIRSSYDLLDRTYSLPNLIEETNKRVLLPEGWLFRDFQSVQKHREVLSKVFKPKLKTKIKLNDFFDSSTNVLKVALHIRRGDYQSFKEGKYFYSYEFYIEIIEKIKSLFGEADYMIYIFSNEKVPEEISSMSKVKVSRNSFIDDFFGISYCDYIIGPPSTFSLVAGFLGGGKLKHVYSKQDLKSLSLSDFTIAEL